MLKVNLLKSMIFTIISLFIITLINGFIYNPNSNGGDDDKPAEEVYKNIQVLKGMPSKDLHMVMHFFRSSLNVKCSFCHFKNEKDNTWIWESDSLDNKLTARRMIEMVKDINTRYWDGNIAVTCFTCHKGNEHPSRTPFLPQTPPSNEVKTERPVPEAKEIFDNYYKALGITNADEIKNIYAKGRSALWDGKSFPVEIYRQAPDKFLSILTAPDGSKIYRGYDGLKGWTKNPQGEVQDVEGYDLEKLKDWANFYNDIDLKHKYTEIKTVGIDTADGMDCFVVRGIINDIKSDRLYFDIKTGLLFRRTTYTKTIIGSLPERVEYGNYKPDGKLMAAYSMRLSSLDPWGETIREFDEVKYNVSTDNISFSKP